MLPLCLSSVLGIEDRFHLAARIPAHPPKCGAHKRGTLVGGTMRGRFLRLDAAEPVYDTGDGAAVRAADEVVGLAGVDAIAAYGCFGTVLGLARLQDAVLLGISVPAAF